MGSIYFTPSIIKFRSICLLQIRFPKTHLWPYLCLSLTNAAVLIVPRHHAGGSRLPPISVSSAPPTCDCRIYLQPPRITIVKNNKPINPVPINVRYMRNSNTPFLTQHNHRLRSKQSTDCFHDNMGFTGRWHSTNQQ